MPCARARRARRRPRRARPRRPRRPRSSGPPRASRTPGRPLAADPRARRHRRLAARDHEPRSLRQRGLRPVAVDQEHHAGRRVRDGARSPDAAGAVGPQRAFAASNAGTASTMALASPRVPERPPAIRPARRSTHPVAQRRGERVGQASDAALRLHEHRGRASRGGPSASAACDPRIRLPCVASHVSSSGNVARADRRSTSPAYKPGEERRHRQVGRLVAQPPAQQAAQRLLDSVLPLAAQQILGGTAPAGPRQARASGTRRRCRRGSRTAHPWGTAPARVGPQVRALRAGGHELSGQPELPAEVHRPGLARDERIGARLAAAGRPPASLPELAARSIGRLAAR